MESGVQGTAKSNFSNLLYLMIDTAYAYYITALIYLYIRTGEPLWAETARLVSKVILMFLFVAFFVFVIIQVIESPKSTYIVTEVPEDGQVTIPGMY